MAIEYEVVGEGRPWVITPGGRFSKDSPGVRELAAALGERGNRVLIWDRPNCGASDVCFTGPSKKTTSFDHYRTRRACCAEPGRAPAPRAAGRALPSRGGGGPTSEPDRTLRRFG